jgi:diguanylate cyclase (GGDEF)-like protein
MPWSVLLSFLATCVFLLLLTYRRRTKVEPALMWALGAGFVGLNEGANEYVFLYTGVSGLILLLGVLEHTYDIAYLDELTGLPNRRAFNEAYRLLRGRYTIAMCDVDHFKEFNDLFGHETGDQVLRMIASRLSRVRGGGRVYRYGGEEFAIIFRRRTAEQVRPIAESLREAVAERKFLLRSPQRDLEGDSQTLKAKREKGPQRSVQVTVSIGLADRTGHRATPNVVLGTADIALYRAKRSGRNCVILAEASVASESA